MDFSKKKSQAEESISLKPQTEMKQKTANMHTALIFFFISNYSNVGDFSIEDNFCIISDCRNSFNEKLKNLTEKQKQFSNPANSLCSSKPSLQMKHLKQHVSIRMCSFFTWFHLFNLDSSRKCDLP